MLSTTSWIGPLAEVVELDLEALTAPRERGVVGGFEIDAQQRQDRPQAALRLAQWQPENEPERHVASLDECSLVLRPISDTIFRLVRGINPRLHIESVCRRPSR